MLEVVLSELDRVGHEKLAFEQVAARAGVNKVTLYRHWPTKLELIRAALLRVSDETPSRPDTGTLRGDLLEQFRVLRAQARKPSRRAVFRLLFDARPGDPIGELVHELRREKDAQVMGIYARALERGELRPDADPRLIHGLLFGAVISFELLRWGDEESTPVEAMIDLVLAGVRSPPKAVRRRPAGGRQAR
ncbi:transcriptional regulator, TetR family [Cystobacter fuscus DSM 2262]|uniref:Transcriptional regulator, TetR family n=1 Tax=Cystobacter fuscus (strain ATCC 25194 / DSM 2262 / NBRC 100088 / M29) TaxID=1242864 RepID=S9PCN0_CYSF2|nr:TetR/AcrR family transcriptional regulator [Cystobacter fuscus]EPX62115.1 transcriptional regulator, TetR family [Cystobacter fuscus DSM 2262]